MREWSWLLDAIVLSWVVCYFSYSAWICLSWILVLCIVAVWFAHRRTADRLYFYMQASNASATLPTFVQKCRMPGLLWQLLCKSIECLRYFCYFCAKASNASATFAYFWPNVSNASATLSTCVQKRQMPQLLCVLVFESVACLSYFAHIWKKLSNALTTSLTREEITECFSYFTYFSCKGLHLWAWGLV